MGNLFFLPFAILLTGCNISEGIGAINWSMPGHTESLTCDDMIGEETPNIQVQEYFVVFENINLCDG